MHIIEHRTYDFSGKFSWADFQLTGLENQKILAFSLSDNNGSYIESSAEDEGTYHAERVANQFYCKWFYRAHSEIRTFKLEYTISNVWARPTRQKPIR